jgi:hypothetical protein
MITASSVARHLAHGMIPTFTTEQAVEDSMAQNERIVKINRKLRNVG